MGKEKREDRNQVKEKTSNEGKKVEKKAKKKKKEGKNKAIKEVHLKDSFLFICGDGN